MTKPTPPIRTATATLALLLALPLALAGCSSGDVDDGPTRAADGVGARWSACMRDAGFAVADASDDQVASGTTTVPSGVDRARFDEQAATCRERLGVAGTSDARAQQWAREYGQVASCIREHGYPDFPEQENGVIDTSGYPRASEPAFEEAFQECLAEYSPDTKTQEHGG